MYQGSKEVPASSPGWKRGLFVDTCHVNLFLCDLSFQYEYEIWFA